MRPVRCTKCVVDIDIRQGSKLLGKFGVVFLFLRIEAGIFEKHDVAGLHRGARLFDFRAYAVVHERDGLAELFGERLRHGREGKLGVGLALRAAEVAREDDHRALVNEVFYGRQSSDDAGVVADFALVVEGNVEVHAHEDFFALEVYILYSLYL